MKLYYSPGACSLSPHITLRESGLDFDLVRVDLSTKKTETGSDFIAINKKGYVPALLLDNGELLTESCAISLWIAAQVPSKMLAPPPETMEYLRLVEWISFISTELHKGFSPIFNPSVPESAKEPFKKRLFSRLDLADTMVCNGLYAMGDNFTVADVYIFTVLSWLKFIGVDLAQWPQLASLSARVAERPTVKAALAAEGLN